MPRVSEFFGILVYMYWMDDKRHKKPHVHVYYSGQSAVFDFAGNCLDGNVSTRVNRLVREWIKERPSELKNAWEKAMNGEEIPWIAPLN